MTIKFREVEIEVTGEFNPAQKGGLETEPLEEYTELTSILWNGLEVYELFKSLDLLDEVEEEIEKEVKALQEY